LHLLYHECVSETWFSCFVLLLEEILGIVATIVLPVDGEVMKYFYDMME